MRDFIDVDIVVKGRVTASFNRRKNDYDNNNFPENLFPNRIFPPGSNAEKITAAGNAAKLLLLILQAMLLMMQETSLKAFLLETMLHLSTVFQKLMGH